MACGSVRLQVVLVMYDPHRRINAQGVGANEVGACNSRPELEDEGTGGRAFRTRVVYTVGAA